MSVWDVEYTDEFGNWWDSLDAEEQDSNFYERMVPIADRIYDEHLGEIG